MARLVSGTRPSAFGKQSVQLYRVRRKLIADGELWELLKAIGSSEKVHVVDALAITGEEGRGSLRKASGSRQTGFDPGMSEWGNPPSTSIASRLK